MIENKEDLKRYLEMDRFALGKTNSNWPSVFSLSIWRFQIVLRYHEYYHNKKNKTLISNVLCRIYKCWHNYLGLQLGFLIPINVFDAGLRINHSGLIVVNPNARIGKYCNIHQGVNVGQQGMSSDDVPVIKDNVWIGPGAKIFGKIVIAEDIQIGANAVVNKSFTEQGITIAGVPAKKISNNANPYKKTYMI